MLPNRQVRIELVGAMQNATYTLSLCRFSTSQVCLSLGSIPTNASGNAQMRLPFPDSGNIFAGVFLLARDSGNQFVSGFNFTLPPAAQAGVEVELRGTISSMGNNSFRLDNFGVDIVVNADTRLQKVDSFSGLKVGQRVDVKGFTMGTTIMATRVKVEDDED